MKAALWEETESPLGGRQYEQPGAAVPENGRSGSGRSFEQCLTLFEQVGNLHGLACAYDNLGQVQMELGNEDEAMDCLSQAAISPKSD